MANGAKPTQVQSSRVNARHAQIASLRACGMRRYVLHRVFVRRSFSADGRLFCDGAFYFILFIAPCYDIASIQSGATAEPWSTGTQYARKGGRKRPRYQSQNGAPRFFFLFPSLSGIGHFSPSLSGSPVVFLGGLELEVWKFSAFSVCRWGAKI